MRLRNPHDIDRIEREHQNDRSINMSNGIATQAIPRSPYKKSRRLSDWLSQITQYARATGEPITRSFK